MPSAWLAAQTKARELDIPGRQFKGIHLAMDYLTQQNCIIAGEHIDANERITAEGKRVVILGGGDTGADCLGTAHRQGAGGGPSVRTTPRASRSQTPQQPLAPMVYHPQVFGSARRRGHSGLQYPNQGLHPAPTAMWNSFMVCGWNGGRQTPAGGQP